MGIQGLERYLLTAHPRACPTVDVAELAAKYKSSTKRRDAVAVVDGSILTYHVASGLDLRYGGQFKELKERTLAFAKRLKDAGLKPVFYFKGSPSEGRLNVWQERKQVELDRRAEIYRGLATPSEAATSAGFVVTDCDGASCAEQTLVTREPSPDADTLSLNAEGVSGVPATAVEEDVSGACATLDKGAVEVSPPCNKDTVEETSLKDVDEESSSLEKDVVEEAPLFDENVVEEAPLLGKATAQEASLLSDAVEESSLLDKDSVEESSLLDKDSVDESSLLDKDSVEESSLLDKDSVEESSLLDKDSVEQYSLDEDFIEESPLLDKDSVEDSPLLDKNSVKESSLLDKDSAEQYSLLDKASLIGKYTVEKVSPRKEASEEASLLLVMDADGHSSLLVKEFVEESSLFDEDAVKQAASPNLQLALRTSESEDDKKCVVEEVDQDALGELEAQEDSRADERVRTQCVDKLLPEAQADAQSSEDGKSSSAEDGNLDGGPSEHGDASRPESPARRQDGGDGADAAAAGQPTRATAGTLDVGAEELAVLEPASDEDSDSFSVDEVIHCIPEPGDLLISRPPIDSPLRRFATALDLLPVGEGGAHCPQPVVEEPTALVTLDDTDEPSTAAPPSCAMSAEATFPVLKGDEDLEKDGATEAGEPAELLPAAEVCIRPPFSETLEPIFEASSVSRFTGVDFALNPAATPFVLTKPLPLPSLSEEAEGVYTEFVPVCGADPTAYVEYEPVAVRPPFGAAGDAMPEVEYDSEDVEDQRRMASFYQGEGAGSGGNCEPGERRNRRDKGLTYKERREQKKLQQQQRDCQRGGDGPHDRRQRGDRDQRRGGSPVPSGKEGPQHLIGPQPNAQGQDRGHSQARGDAGNLGRQDRRGPRVEHGLDHHGSLGFGDQYGIGALHGQSHQQLGGVGDVMHDGFGDVTGGVSWGMTGRPSRRGRGNLLMHTMYEARDVRGDNELFAAGLHQERLRLYEQQWSHGRGAGQLRGGLQERRPLLGERPLLRHELADHRREHQDEQHGGPGGRRREDQCYESGRGRRQKRGTIGDGRLDSERDLSPCSEGSSRSGRRGQQGRGEGRGQGRGQERDGGCGQGRDDGRGQGRDDRRGRGGDRQDQERGQRRGEDRRSGRDRGVPPSVKLLGGHDMLLPSGTFECVKLALKEAGFEVRVSVDEFDVEVARYARERSCFCILSRDTDFVALEGARHYLSLGHLDLESMRTVCFDRDAIARSLRLNHRAELPLLLSLVPNGCVPASYLLPLHNRVLSKRYFELSAKQRFRLEELLPALVNMVKVELWGKSAEDTAMAVVTKSLAMYPPDLLNRFCAEIGFTNRWQLREALKVQMEASLRAYDFTPYKGEALPAVDPAQTVPGPFTVDPKVLAAARARHSSLRFLSPSTLVLLSRGVVEQGATLEDPALPAGAAHSADALRPFRRRVYGVVLGAAAATAADRQGPVSVREYIVPSCVPDGAKIQPVDVEPIWPDPDDLPRQGLLTFWNGRNPKKDKKKKQLEPESPSSEVKCGQDPAPVLHLDDVESDPTPDKEEEKQEPGEEKPEMELNINEVKDAVTEEQVEVEAKIEDLIEHGEKLTADDTKIEEHIKEGLTLTGEKAKTEESTKEQTGAADDVAEHLEGVAEPEVVLPSPAEVDEACWRLLARSLCPSVARSSSSGAGVNHDDGGVEDGGLAGGLRALPRRLALPAAALFLLHHTGALDASLAAAVEASAAHAAAAAAADGSGDGIADDASGEVEGHALDGSLPGERHDLESRATADAPNPELPSVEAAVEVTPSSEAVAAPPLFEEAATIAETSPEGAAEVADSASVEVAAVNETPSATPSASPSHPAGCQGAAAGGGSSSPASPKGCPAPASGPKQQQPAAEAPLAESAEELAEMIAKACVLTGSLSAAQLAALPSPRPRRLAVHLAAHFMRAWLNVALLNDALGAPVPLNKLQPADFFNGKVFHCVYTKVPLPVECDDTAVQAMLRAARVGRDPQACAECRPDFATVSAAPPTSVE